MKKFIFTLLSVFTVVMLFCAPVSQKEAVKLANRFIKSGNLSIQEIRITDLAYTEQNLEGDVLFYVFNKDGGGFIIVSGEDVTLPILGYSDVNKFEKENIPINMEGMLAEYRSEIIYAQKSGLTLNDEILKAREEQLDNVSQYRASVAPLLGDIKWNQSPYYNALCPVYNQYGSRCPVGCVATAMAQIMKYWSYPTRGQGSHSYKSTYGTLYADFDVTYNWDAMPAATLTAPNSECAKISYHCAVSVDMSFGPNGSGAYQTSVPYALINYFKYKNTAKNAHKNNYSATQWANLVRSELDANRPVQYAGHGTGGGHSFVCDGYKANGYFHFNWGWGGVSDGYFLLNALNPGSLGTGGGSGGFNSSQTIVYGIEPAGGVTPPTPPTPPNPGSLATPEGLSTTNITATTATLKWNSVEGATGYTIELRKESGSWSSYDITGTTAEASSLTSNTTYEWRVKAVNNSTSSEFSSVVSFTTLSDGGSAVEYCNSTARTSYYEWISRIAMSNIDNISSGSKYADYTNKVINVAKGDVIPVYMQSGYRGRAYTEYWTIWIDYNQDGIFSNDEIAVKGYYTAGYLLKGYVSIPESALEGTTRMRVSMKYGSYPTACETFRYGEVEDYSINIGTQSYVVSHGETEELAFTLNTGEAEEIAIYPNPAVDHISVTMEQRDGDNTYMIYDMTGRVVMTGILSESNRIEVSSLEKGVYILSVGTERTQNTQFIKQ